MMAPSWWDRTCLVNAAMPLILTSAATAAQRQRRPRPGCIGRHHWVAGARICRVLTQQHDCGRSSSRGGSAALQDGRRMSGACSGVRCLSVRNIGAQMSRVCNPLLYLRRCQRRCWRAGARCSVGSSTRTCLQGMGWTQALLLQMQTRSGPAGSWLPQIKAYRGTLLHIA